MAQVVGIGLDLTLLSRMRSAYMRHGTRLAAKMLHPDEMREFASLVRSNEDVRGCSGGDSSSGGGGGGGGDDRNRSTRFLASRWAAKEAAYKAVGRRGLAFPHLRVHGGGRGAPGIELATQEARHVAAHVQSLLLTLTHDGDYVAAMLVALSPPSPPSQ